MEIELTRCSHKAFKSSDWVVDLILSDKIQTGSFTTKKDALSVIKSLKEKHNIKGFKRNKDEVL